MNERPILFSGPMVQAILAGTKTQTRRVVKNPYTPAIHAPDSPNVPWVSDCPYGAPGDRLWVRETWAEHGSGYVYRATIGTWPHHWAPSIFMPRKASRITLEVVSVRVERLQDISEADAQAEGMHPLEIYTPRERRGQSDYRGAFALTWDGINAARGYGWESNPWVWALEFKRVEP